VNVDDEERAEAIRTNATIIVNGSLPAYRIENREAHTVIADGFVTKAVAERYAQSIRDQQKQMKNEA